MRKYLLLVLFTMALILSACGAEPEPEPAPVPEPEPAAEPSLYYSSALQDEQGNHWACFEMSVPQEIYDAFSEPAALAVSDDLMAFAERESEAWLDEQWMLRVENPTAESEFTLDLTLFYQDAEIVAITGNGYSYVSGAAHPSVYAYGFVFDAETGQRVSIGQLLGENWQAELFPAIYSSIETDGDLPVYFSDLETALRNAFREDGWYADGNSIYVTYNPAEIAPYAMGTPCFQLPR